MDAIWSRSWLHGGSDLDLRSAHHTLRMTSDTTSPWTQLCITVWYQFTFVLISIAKFGLSVGVKLLYVFPRTPSADGTKEHSPNSFAFCPM